MAQETTYSRSTMPSIPKGPRTPGGPGGPGPGGPGARFAPGQKAKNAKGTLRRIVRIYLQSGKSIFLAILFTALASGLSVALPLFVGEAINTFHTDTNTVDQPVLITLLLIMLGLHLLNWACNTFGGVVMLKASEKLVFTLRQDFFAKMQKLPLSFYDTHSHGDTMSRLTNDVDNISSTIAQATTQLVSSLLTIIGSMAVMLSLNLPLTLIVLLCIPLIALLTRVVAKTSRGYFSAQQKSLGQLNGIIEEDILGLKMVKAFQRQEDSLKKFAGVNESLYESSRKAQIWSGFMMPLMNVINNLIFTLVAIVSGVFCTRYGMLVGTAVTFLSYSKQFGRPLNAVASMFNTIQSALAGAERVFETLDEPQEPADAADAVELTDPRGDVSFEDVCFSYLPEKPILKHITFTVRAGETIALVGETGAGKTTIVNLLTRFYDTNSGCIRIDGVDVTKIKRANLRNCFSVVLQDTCLFTGTIMDNIRYSKPEATDEEVIAAAKFARAHAFIERLPKGYQTMVSGSADTLSQGQRQLLAIARAVLCDCPILILDEATSSVDTKTEKDIQRAMLKLMKDHTSFLIAHRLSTIRDADRILVLGNGEILEEGNHESLMRQKGHYYEMVVSQMGL